MRTIHLITLAFALSLPGCSWFSGDNKGDKSESVDPEQLKKAIGVAKAIKKDPDSAAAALKEAGLSRGELEELVYKIALDDAAADKYAKALREGK
jgi:hypothetical protein